jgi:hypothetical protein
MRRLSFRDSAEGRGPGIHSHQARRLRIAVPHRMNSGYGLWPSRFALGRNDGENEVIE